MKRIAFGLGLFVATALLLYKASFFFASRMVHGEDTVPAQSIESSTSELQRLVIETLVPAVLKDATVVEDESVARNDDMGTWNSVRMAWKLPVGADTDRIATRIVALTEEMAPEAKVYRSRPDALVENLRIYVGKRLTHHLSLIPTLSERLPPRPDEPTSIAVVVLGMGNDGSQSRTILAQPFPMTVAIEPFSPFAMRQAEDAKKKLKEVLCQIEEPISSGQELVEKLVAVPNATGIALKRSPAVLPIDKLRDDSLYLLDVNGELESDALRAASNAGIPSLRLNHAFKAGDELRLGHMARVSEALIVTVNASVKSDMDALSNWVQTAEAIRPVFLSELLEP